MDWCRLQRSIHAAVMLHAVMVLLEESEADCPDSYWDEPSKNCASFIVSILKHVRPEELRVNRTCALLQQTTTCYQQLIRQCLTDVTATRELRSHIGRYHVYSMLCSADYAVSPVKQKLVSCFLPRVKPTLTCTEAYDTYFRNLVQEKQFKSACRIVNTAFQCFHDIVVDIESRCQPEVAEEYRRNYIRPLVDQSRDTVRAKCVLSPPFEQYFTSTAPTVESFASLAGFCTLLALIFAWRQHLSSTPTSSSSSSSHSAL